MKTIRISEEVWEAIAAQGRFGETEDVVLRRVFKIALDSGGAGRADGPGGDPGEGSKTHYAWKERRAKDRLNQEVVNGKLVLEFDSGPRREWALPAKEDSRGIRRVRDEAVQFVKDKRGTTGQQYAAMRALTSRGYHVTVKREYE